MSDPYPHSPTARQHKSGIPPSPRPSPPPPATAAASPGGGSSNTSPTRYSLRFVTSSPGTSPTKRLNRSPSAGGVADNSARGDDAVNGQNDLHGESIAYDLSGLVVQQSPLLGDSSPARKSGGSGGISSSPSYIIRPRKFSDPDGMLSSRGTAADYSPDSSSDGGIEEALEAAKKRTASVAAANNQAVYGFITPTPSATNAFHDPFSGAPGVPPLTPMTDVVELTPTVEAAVKAASKVTGSATGDGGSGVRSKSRMVDPTGRAIDTKGDVWASAAFRSIVNSADCILAIELGDRNYLKQRYEDAVECYEEGLEMAYTSLHSMMKQKALADRPRASASSSTFLDDEMPSDEEGGPPEEKDFEDQSPLKPNVSFLKRIGSGTSIDADQSDVVLIAFASICLREGNAFFRMGEWNEARRSYHDSKGYLLLIKAAPSLGSGKDPPTANRAAILSKTKIEGQIMNNLAAIEASTGRHQHATTEYAEALRVKRRSLRSMLKQDKDVLGSTVLSKEDAVLDITTTLTNIGQLRQKIAKHSKAEEAYKQALSLRVEKCGERDLSVASTLYRMGDLYFMQGKYDRALRSYNEVLSIYKKVGANDPQAATMLHNLGLCHFRVGPYSRAKTSLKQALKIKKAQQSEPNFDIASTYHLLGIVLTAMGQFDSAMKCLVAALRIRQKELNESAASAHHLSVLNTRLAIGEVHRHRGKLDEAMAQSRLVCEDRIKRLGFGHEASAEALQCVGLVLREKGEFDEAVAVLDKSLSVRKSRLGEESPLVAETLVHLSSCYFKLRKVDEATVASDEALRITTKVMDPDHVLHSNSLKSVADLQQAKGQFDQALKGYDEVLRIKERWLGNSHLECADTYNNVGNAKFKQGDFQGAKEAFTKALEIKRTCLDNGHTSLYTTLNNLGHANYKVRDLDGALDMYEQSVQCQMQRICPPGAKSEEEEVEEEREFDFLKHLQEIIKKIEALRDDRDEMERIQMALGNVASTLRNIGLVKQDQSNIDEALEVYDSILTVRKSMPFVDHTAVALTAETIGMLHFKRGNHGDALAAFEEALNVKQMTQGTQTLDYARTLNNVANVHFSAGTLDQAMKLYQEALVIKKEQLGEAHDEVANTQNNVAHLLFTLGRDEECLEAYNEVLRMRKNKFGPDHLAVATTQSNIGDLHVKMENPRAAVEAFQESVRIRKLQEDSSPADVSRALDSLASTCGNLGAWDQACDAYKETLALKKRAYGGQHEEIIKALDLLAMTLIEQSHFMEATQPVKEALELRRRRFGNEHPEVVSQINALAFLYKKAGDEAKAKSVLSEITPQA
mmetsp:Transcript_2135/g.6166  ORF Transcript_2135/g.6166 Transcript_2135/m.6166 type:complete len:1308 (-) Transcript_2135:156-4079(-)|eukprot:CAMPEP_0181030112 /NCGR_PEP_ID=MMETSP1070-20121207/5555_1 /TAXON_ID=265543 /ORGANISM="Minutocellus polymorphus, Strain NH13" /LENGTH=1307 /DNA_ID=CAMNT_0023107461 /DNA_START=192 /DNA_END=4115 /DNA_ORIENTATION=+